MGEAYFSHDSDASSDLKIQSMMMSYGAAGYGLYWIIVEQMRKQEPNGYRLPLKHYTHAAIARIAGVTPDEVRQFVTDCCEEHDLFVCDGEWVWSESLLRRMEIKDAKREQREEQAKRAADKRWKGSKDAQSTQDESSSNADPIPGHAQAMPEHAVSMPEQCDSNAKNAKAKAKGKAKEEELENSSPPAHASKKSAVKSPPEKADPLYHRLKESYEAQWDDDTLPDYAREGPALKRMVAEANAKGRDSPEEWARKFVTAHWRLKQDPKSLLNGQPFLPSIAMSSGLKPRIIEAMQGSRQPEEQLSDRDKRKLASLGITL